MWLQQHGRFRLDDQPGQLVAGQEISSLRRTPFSPTWQRAAVRPTQRSYALALVHLITWLDTASVDLDHIDDHLIHAGPSTTSSAAPWTDRDRVLVSHA